MIARVLQFAGLVTGAAIFVVAIAYPAGALIARALATAPSSSVVYDFPTGLWLRSTLLAACGALAAIVLALPGAFVVARGSSSSRAPSAGLLIAPLLFPAMVYAFGWERLLPGTAETRCVWVWASWAWPVPALLLGAGWRGLGRRRYEAALLSTTPLRAFVHGVLPMLWRHVLVSFLLLFAFFLGDYAVPHACGLIVYATELLLAAESSLHPRAALKSSLPVAMMIVVALAAAGVIWRRLPEIDESDDAVALRTIGPARWIAPLMVLLCVGFPIVGLLRSVSIGAAISETLRTYGVEMAASLGVALLGGVIAMVMGAALAALPVVRRVALLCSLICAAVPGALVGAAVILAYLPAPRIYDHWVILVIGYVARFGWIGIATGWLAQQGVGRAQLDAARSDGAGAVTASWRVALAGNLPTLVCGALIVAAFSLSEAATTALVRVPSVNPVALILIEKFHRFEDGILVGISLLLVLAALPGAMVLAFIGRRTR